MTTINPEEQDDKKDKVPETTIAAGTTPAPTAPVKEADKNPANDDEDDDDGGRDVPPLSGKKR